MHPANLAALWIGVVFLAAGASKFALALLHHAYWRSVIPACLDGPFSHAFEVNGLHVVFFHVFMDDLLKALADRPCERASFSDHYKPPSQYVWRYTLFPSISQCRFDDDVPDL